MSMLPTLDIAYLCKKFDDSSFLSVQVAQLLNDLGVA